MMGSNVAAEIAKLRAERAAGKQNIRRFRDQTGRDARKLLEDVGNSIRADYEAGLALHSDRGKALQGVYAQFTGPYRMTVGNRAPHARFIEFGRGPGRRPPVEAIRQWVGRNFAHFAGMLHFRTAFTRERRTGKGLLAPAQRVTNSVAFLIGRKIGRYGTRPYPALRRALLNARVKFPALAKARMQVGVR